MDMINIGDVVVSKKNHPCGGNRFVCVRTGADYKFKCLTCEHVVMIDGAAVGKFVKKKENPNG